MRCCLWLPLLLSDRVCWIQASLQADSTTRRAEKRRHLPNGVEIFPSSRLRFHQQLGKGNFGSVLKAEAMDLLHSGKWDVIAVKSCKGQRKR